MPDFQPEQPGPMSGPNPPDKTSRPAGPPAALNRNQPGATVKSKAFNPTTNKQASFDLLAVLYLLKRKISELRVLR